MLDIVRSFFLFQLNLTLSLTEHTVGLFLSVRDDFFASSVCSYGGVLDHLVSFRLDRLKLVLVCFLIGEGGIFSLLRSFVLCVNISLALVNELTHTGIKKLLEQKENYQKIAKLDQYLPY